MSGAGGLSKEGIRRTGSLSGLESDDENGILTPPRAASPVQKPTVTVMRGGMLGFSSLSKELRAEAEMGRHKASTLANPARESIDISNQSPEETAESMRRLLRISSGMAPSSWHEGSKYLNEK